MAGQVRKLLRPRVYLEEWDAPLISGIGWVLELVPIAGGADVFPELARQAAAKDRIVSLEAVLAAAPEVILASWCGKKVVPSRITSRSGWSAMPAVAQGRIVEITSPLILQDDPVALMDGLDAILVALGHCRCPPCLHSEPSPAVSRVGRVDPRQDFGSASSTKAFVATVMRWTGLYRAPIG